MSCAPASDGSSMTQAAAGGLSVVTPRMSGIHDFERQAGQYDFRTGKWTGVPPQHGVAAASRPGSPSSDPRTSGAVILEITLRGILMGKWRNPLRRAAGPAVRATDHRASRLAQISAKGAADAALGAAAIGGWRRRDAPDAK
jgi:hypothetical protein